MPESKDFFVSYNKANVRMAEWIAFELEKAGYAVVFQAWDSRPGSNFIAWIHESSIHCERTLAVLSPEYFAAKFPEMEWTSAMYSGKLLPVRVVDMDVPGLFGPIAYIDLVGLNEDAARRALLGGVELDRTKPVSVGFPGKPSGSIRPPSRFPGSPPPACNLPLRNPNFTGRNELIDDLLDSLTSSSDATVIQAFTGMGGIGKSQLALEFAHRYASDYDLIWWMHAEDPLVLATEFAALAAELDLPEREHQEQDVVIQAVKRVLQQRAHWLLVFDNAKDERDLLPFLPSGSGHAVITSRKAYWSRITRSISIGTWPRPESVAFLTKLTNLADEAGASAVANLLGDLPLALEQAAAFIAQGGLSFQRYAERFTERRTALWKRERPPPDYPETVSTTLSLAIDTLSADQPAARTILNALALFAPEDIPRQFLEPLHELDESGQLQSDPDALHDGIAALHTYSLLTASPATLSVHRLVQAVVADEYMEKIDHAVRWAIGTVLKAWPDGSNPLLWPECEGLLPHARRCIKQTERRGLAFTEAASLTNKIGLYLHKRAVLDEAELFYAKAIDLYQSEPEKNGLFVAFSRNNLAELYNDLGRYEKAEPLFQKALEFWETKYGGPDALAASILNNLAGLYRNTGRYDEAVSLYEQVLELRKVFPGPDDSSTAMGYNNLGEMYQLVGRSTDAQRLLNQAIALYESTLGDSHPDIARSYNNLGLVLFDQGKYEDAERFFQKAMRIFVATMGEDHPFLARSYLNLGTLYAKRRQYEEAESFHEKALTISQEKLGETHPDTAKIFNNIAECYREQKRFDEARVLYDKSLAILESVLGRNHPETANGYYNLGLLSFEQERFEEAEALLKQALVVYQSSLGDNHPHTITMKRNVEDMLGDIEGTQGSDA